MGERNTLRRGTTRSRFAPGELTIIDLSDPFIDPASACGLFEVITRLFVRADVGTGKVLVVDEAHKVCVHSDSNYSQIPHMEYGRGSQVSIPCYMT